MQTAPTDPVESGDPAADPRAFRRCLGQFATGVTVMTTMADGRPVGMTANSFASLSLDPPLVLWSVARSARRFETFVRAPSFAVNVLGSEQVALSQLFASPVEDRFAALDWYLGEGGAPILPGLLAVFECGAEAVHDGGDHAIVVGRVTRYARYAGGGLVYAQGRYAVAEDHPTAIRARESAPTGSFASEADRRLMSLISYVATYASHAFDGYRLSEGVNILQSRAVFALGAGPADIDDVLRRSDLSRPSAEDALASLQERDAVSVTAGMFSLTGAGRELFARLVAQLDRFEADLFAGLPDTDLAAGRRVLETLLRRLGPVQPSPGR